MISTIKNLILMLATVAVVLLDIFIVASWVVVMIQIPEARKDTLAILLLFLLGNWIYYRVAKILWRL
jgi:hypothetical protein